MNTISLMKKLINLDECPVLFDTPFDSATWWQHWKVRDGDWSVDGEWVTGNHPHNTPGMITSTANYTGNVILEFEARTVLPSTHDINCMWNGSWNEATNTRDVAYVAGLQGWWEGKVGFERSPEYTFTAGTPLFAFEPARIYHMRAGSIDGHVFVVVDGQLLLEITDPNPIDHSRYGMVGFEAYCSCIQIRKPVVRQIVWHSRPQSYEPEF